MMLEAIRCLVAGLTDATIGVNTMLAAATLESGDARPADVTVYDSVRHGWVARRSYHHETDAATLPALVVLVPDSASTAAQVMTVVRDGELPVFVGYIRRTEDAAAGNVAAMITQRCVKRTLRRFFANENAAMRARNGIVVGAVLGDLEEFDTETKFGEAVVTAGLQLTLHVRETSP